MTSEDHTGPAVTREHLQQAHGVLNLAMYAPSLLPALHVRLHDEADETLHSRGMLYVKPVRCDTEGHYVRIGEDRCDCGIERLVLP